MLEKEFDIKFTYVPFGGGGDVAKNLIGGHIDSTVNNPSEQLSFWKAGRSRVLATFTPERLELMPDTPTMTELGHPLVYEMQRSFVGGPGMPAEAQAFYVDMFNRLAALDEWQTYAADNALLTDLLTGDALQSYFLEERDKHKALLESMSASG